MFKLLAYEEANGSVHWYSCEQEESDTFKRAPEMDLVFNTGGMLEAEKN